MSEPVRLNSLEFLLDVAETYATNETFTFDIVLGPSDNFVCTFILTLEFGVIFELLVWLKVRRKNVCEE